MNRALFWLNELSGENISLPGPPFILFANFNTLTVLERLWHTMFISSKVRKTINITLVRFQMWRAGFYFIIQESRDLREMESHLYSYLQKHLPRCRRLWREKSKLCHGRAVLLLRNCLRELRYAWGSNITSKIFLLLRSQEIAGCSAAR